MSEGVSLGAQSAQFDNPGDEVSGEFLSVEQVHQTNMNTGEVEYWDADRKRPKTMVSVMVDTTVGPDGNKRAPHKDAGEDGTAMLHISGNKWTAFKRVTSRIDPGAWGRCKFTEYSDRDPKVKGHNRAKLYEAEYKAPGTWRKAGASLNDEPPF